MKLDVVDNNGKKIEDLNLEKEVFGQKYNKDLLSQYINVFKTNQRQGTSAAKTRAEVSGGGKKPWRQKGTGRARHGSIRSPIWSKGGVAHGPKPSTYSLSLPKSMKKRAMQSALSFKVSEGEVKVINEIKMTKPSTKNMKELLDKINLADKTLVVTEKPDIIIQKSMANLPKAKVVFADMLNIYDLLDAVDVLFEKKYK